MSETLVSFLSSLAVAFALLLLCLAFLLSVLWAHLLVSSRLGLISRLDLGRRAAEPPTLDPRAPTALRRGKKDKPLSLDAMTLLHNPPDITKAPPTKLRSPGTPCRTRTYASLTAHAV